MRNQSMTILVIGATGTVYPSNCGVSLHLKQTPAESEDSVVTSVQYQVLDIKAMNAFRAKHPQH